MKTAFIAIGAVLAFLPGRPPEKVHLLDTARFLAQDSHDQFNANVFIPSGPRRDDRLLVIWNHSEPVVTVTWNGDVRYNTNNTARVASECGKVFLAMRPEVRRRLVMSILQESLPNVH